MSGDMRTQRGRAGKKWVGLNYKEKESAKEANGGAMPYTLSLVTSDFPHKTEWSEVDLPDILFYIHPPHSGYEGVKIKELIENGQTVASDAPDGHNIRHFDVLPRFISLDVPGWLIEAWRRLDPRIGYQDILDRQYADPEYSFVKHSKNALQNHCRRECRKVLNTWVEYGRRDEPHRTEVESIEGLAYENVLFNTILKRSLIFPNRLVKIRLERRVEDGLYYAVPREVTTENWEETTLPLDYFLLDSQPFEMTQDMHAAFETYLELMERAEVHGLEHWSKLDRSCLPISWYDRTRTKSVPNETYDGGCKVCTWSLDRKLPADDVKFGEGGPFTPRAKRRRAASSTKTWDIGNTPKTPKRRITTRLSSQRQDATLNGQIADERTVTSFTYVETYGDGDPESYTLDSNGNPLLDEDPGDEDFVYRSSEADQDDEEDQEFDEDEEAEEDDEGEPTHIKPDPSPIAEEQASGILGNVEARDPFTTPSTGRASRQTSRMETTADISSSPSQHSEAGSWLPRSNIVRADSMPQELGHSLSSFVEEAKHFATDHVDIPGYVPASTLSSQHSSFRSSIEQPWTSFAANDADFSTTASSFAEGSHPAISSDHTSPTPYTVGFPADQLTDQFHPLSMTQSEAAFHNFYPLPPRIATYQNQMSFMSSPPRPSESNWGWSQDRARRHSDTDARFGPSSNVMQLGAFTYGPPAVSSDLASENLGNDFSGALELPSNTPDDQLANLHALAGDESGLGYDDVQDLAIDRTLGSSYNNELLDSRTGSTTAPWSVFQV